MIIPCPNQSDCPCDNNPLTGYNADTPDVATYAATEFVAVVPTLGSTWSRYTCQATALSTSSLTAAQLAAQQTALGCALGAISPFGPGGSTGGGGTTLYYSAPQECTVFCPDGLPFTFVVPAAAFVNSSQAAADAAAFSYACSQAAQRAICMGNLSNPIAFYNQAYNGSITATGGNLGPSNVWQIVAGGLPAGLTFNGGSISGNTVTITGTTTAQGVYPFTVSVTDPSGDVMTKQFVLNVNCPVDYTTTTNNTVNCSAVVQPPVWTAFTPSAPYDTGFQILNPGGSAGCPNFSTLINLFTGNPGDVWNWKLTVTNGAGSVLVNGVTVFSSGFIAGTQTFTGTFNGPTNCASPTAVEAEFTSKASTNTSCQFAWQTPTS